MGAIDDLFAMTKRAKQARSAMDKAVVRNDTADYHKQLRDTPEVRQIQLLKATTNHVLGLSRQRKDLQKSGHHPDTIAVHDGVLTNTMNALSDATVQWVKEKMPQPTPPPQPPPAAGDY